MDRLDEKESVMTKFNKFASVLAIALIGGLSMAPIPAKADDWNRHRQSEKNQWGSLAVGAGAIGVLGAITHNKTVAGLGLAGAIYSGYRYSQDDGRDNRWDWNHRRDRDRDWDRHHDRNDRWDRDRHDRDWHRDH